MCSCGSLCKELSYLVKGSGHYPCYACGVDGYKDGPFPCACFVAYGCDGGQAREIEQNEKQETVCNEGCYAVGCHLASQIFILLVAVGRVGSVVVENAHGRCHNFFGSYARHQTDVELPVEALSTENGFYGLADVTYEALLLLLLWRETFVVWKIA